MKRCAFFLFLLAIFPLAGCSLHLERPVIPTTYEITNPNDHPLTLQQQFTDSAGFKWSFLSTIPPHQSKTYSVARMPEIPSPFHGTLKVIEITSRQNPRANLPFKVVDVTSNTGRRPSAKSTSELASQQTRSFRAR